MALPIKERLIYRSLKETRDLATQKTQLREYLQSAIVVEFSTIPPYLTALYSIKDKTAEVYQVIRSVALEEMLHINLACNLMNAIADAGAGLDQRPKFVIPGLSPPTYPTYVLPNEIDLPYIQLMATSIALMKQTFMGIEEPAPLREPESGQPFETIGQFYEAIKIMFEDCVETAGGDETLVFTGDPAYQRLNYYFGSGGGKPIEVTDLASAKLAIDQIMQQGEGAMPPTTEYRAKQPWGSYNQYGNRSDGTYGPILGTPFELSHYFKFKDIADGIVPLPEVYPMLPNPSPDKFQTQDALDLAEDFDIAYSSLVRSLEVVFSSPNTITPDPYFTVIVGLMQDVLPSLATELMNTPIMADGDSTLGPVAGPCFQYTPLILSDLKAKVSEAKQKLAPAAKAKEVAGGLRSRAASMKAALDRVDGALEKILSKIAGSSLQDRL